MKRIKSFRLFESRTSQITDAEFVMLVKENCKDYLANPKYMQRMKGKFNGDYSYIDPKMHRRIPFMADITGVVSAHHTLLMDNLPSWKGFPKRSESVIGNLSFSYDTSFGERCYLVIPYDGANFGLAPSSDLWGSYCEVGNMKYELRERSNVWGLSYIDNIFKSFSSDGIESVEEGFDKYFAPQKFSSRTGELAKEFRNVGYEGLESTDCREFWTDSRCILVYLADLGRSSFHERRDEGVKGFAEVLKMLGLSDEKIELSLKSVGGMAKPWIPSE